MAIKDYAIMRLKTSIVLLIIVAVFLSCRKEETELIETPEDEILEANSNIAGLIEKTTSNDGSLDNIVDKANCFNVVFPYLVNVNGVQVPVNSEEDYAVIECVFDESDSDTDSLNIIFPVTIMLADFSEAVINNITEFSNYTNICNGENIADDDIECIDFQYPIVASVFNPDNELLETIILENDRNLFNFVFNIDDSSITTLDFPILVILSDNSTVSINNFVELRTTIENAIDTCDEDDDYDYSDDDCNDCAIADIATLLINCADWQVNRLKRDAIDHDDVYEGYNFNFFNNGIMSVFFDTNTVMGTWMASGSGNNLEVVIDIPALPLCNNNWILQEIKNCSEEIEINLVLGDNDRLQYTNNCN